jgi:hypothetical protein
MRFYRVLFLLLLSLPTFAQEVCSDSTILPQLDPGLNFSSSFGIDNPNFNFNRFVPGADNGTLLRLGGNLKLALNYVEGAHEWHNKLGMILAYNLDQFVSDFVKARDNLSIESTYYYSLTSWMGLFGRARLNTSIMPGLDIQPAQSPTNYRVFDVNGNLSSSTTATRLTLTGAFSPMILNESVGVFTRPMTESYFSWEATLSAMAVQGFLNGQLEIVDVDATVDPSITTVNTLENFYQIGLSVGNRVWGSFDKQFYYTGSLELGYMFYDSALVNLPNAFENNAVLMASVGLRYQPLPWLGVSWEGNAIYQPYITTNFQFDSILNLNFCFSL